MLWFTENELQEENLGFHKAVNNYFNKINQNIVECNLTIASFGETIIAENSITCPNH